MVFADRFNLVYDLPDHWPNLGICKVFLHLFQIFFSFLVLFLITPIISAQRNYNISTQPAPNFVLTLSLLSSLLAFLLAICPWERFHKGRIAKFWSFFLRPRKSLIFTIFFSAAWFIGMLSITIHASSKANCLIDPVLSEKYPDYAGIWWNQCQCAKAAAAFSWVIFFLWILTAISSAIMFWHEKLKYKQSSAHNEKTSCSVNEDIYIPPFKQPNPFES